MKTTINDLKRIFASAIPADILAKLDPAQPMAAQGVDSLAMTTLAVALQDAYKLKISVEDGIKLRTLNDVVAFVNNA